MRNYRRHISTALAALLIAANMSGAIQAKSYTDVAPGTAFSQEIGILSDIGIIKGITEDEFSPDELVTREQMALLLFRLMIGKDTAGSLNTSPFTDLANDTYFGAISWANASGYILGIGEQSFAPRSGITLQDAMTMLVRALGHSSPQMNGGYPWTFIDAGVKLGLDDGLEDLKYTKELTRREVAALLYNALTAEYLIPRTASNGMTFYESTTIIEQVFGYKIDEATVAATNNFAIAGLDTVTKTGYVTLKTAEGVMTVKYSELGLEGTADENLGEQVRVVYKKDDKSGLIAVLGATELSKVEKPEKLEFGKDNAHVLIGEVKYQVVETLSDSLATNANELLVYAYDADGQLTQVKTNAELAALTGAFDARLIYDNSESETANRLIIKSYAFGQYKLNGGKVNLAENNKLTDIKLTAPEGLDHEDHVLYYYNAAHKTLEVAAVLPVSDVETVTKLTSTTATVGGVKYDLGNEKLGVSAESIKAKLTLGEKVRIVTLNGAIIAVDSASVSSTAASKYLVAESVATPVFTNGRFGYVVEANVDGKTETIFVTNQDVNSGEVYRYTVDSDGVYTLIPAKISGGVVSSGLNQFVQSGSWNDELAFIVKNTNGTTLTNNGTHFTLAQGNADAVSSSGLDQSSVSFVVDANSYIIIDNGESYQLVRGELTSEVVIDDGATVTAVFSNEPGSVETLRFMHISSGSLGSVNSTATSVKVLENTGRELENGQVYSIYSVLNLANGKIEVMRSLSDTLEAGKNYLTRVDGLISDSEADIISGSVTGYTASTVTVDAKVYALASNVAITKLNDDNTIESIALSDIMGSEVEIIITSGKVSSVIVLG